MGCNGCDLLRQVRDMPFAFLESDRLVGASWQATGIHIPIYESWKVDSARCWRMFTVHLQSFTAAAAACWRSKQLDALSSSRRHILVDGFNLNLTCCSKNHSVWELKKSAKLEVDSCSRGAPRPRVEIKCSANGTSAFGGVATLRFKYGAGERQLGSYTLNTVNREVANQ